LAIRRRNKTNNNIKKKNIKFSKEKKKMILRKFENIMEWKGEPRWRNGGLFEKMEVYSRAIITANLTPDQIVEMEQGILYYLTYGEDFGVNIRPHPNSPRGEGSYIFLGNGDAIGLVLFHTIGKVYILKDAVMNVLTNMGFSPISNVPTSESHNDVYLNNAKVFGEKVGISNVYAWESGQLNVNWDGRGDVVSTKEVESCTREDCLKNELSAEEKLKPITGLEQEATRVKISFDRKDVEPLLIAEIERLLETTKPIPVKMEH
jgi:hypothetical protein